MIIEYYTKNVYGKTNYYFANPGMESSWQVISGRKTFNSADIETLELMFGVKFKEIIQPK